MRIEIDTHGDEQTMAVGQRLGSMLRAGDLAALRGPMGAGKTTFVRGVAKAMNVEAALVASPTYVIIHEYPGDPVNLVHVDAYRLTGAGDLDSLGWDRVRNGPAAIIVEWPERLEDALSPAETVRITLTPTGEMTRRIIIEPPDSWRDRPGLAALGATLATMCPITGGPVPADSPTWPFADQRARMADLYRWFSGHYVASRELGEADRDEQGDA